MLIFFIVLFLATLPSAAKADVIGTVPLNGGGLVYLTDTKPEHCRGFLSAEARDVAGVMRATGCWGYHNRTVLVLWVDGPAEVVDFQHVNWREDEKPETGTPAQSGAKS